MKKHQLLTTALVILSGFGMTSSALAQRPAMHLGSDWRAMSVADCTYKAMNFMERERFINGTKTGNQAWGFNEKTIVLVYCTPQNNGVYISVVAASHDSGEAERMRNRVREYVFNEFRPTPETPPAPDFFDEFDATPPRARNYPAMHWGSDSRPRTFEACISDAKSAMRIKDLQVTASSGSSVVWGSNADVIVLVQCIAVDNGVRILVAAAGQNAERYRNDIREFVFK